MSRPGEETIRSISHLEEKGEADGREGKEEEEEIGW